MENRIGQTERNQLHHELIDIEDRPCWGCGSHSQREIHRIRPGHDGGQYTRDNVLVLCRPCHLLKHPWSKFVVGDTVILDGRTPTHVELRRHTPRRIVAIRYDTEQLCNYYTLGSNGRGESKDGNPQDGFAAYEFRSYMLLPYQPRRYHYHRCYHCRVHCEELNTISCGLNSETATLQPDKSPTAPQKTGHFQGLPTMKPKYDCTMRGEREWTLG